MGWLRRKKKDPLTEIASALWAIHGRLGDLHELVKLHQVYLERRDDYVIRTVQETIARAGVMVYETKGG